MTADTWATYRNGGRHVGEGERARSNRWEERPQQPLKEREGFSRASWLLRREVALARARRQIGIGETHGEIVHLAVEFVRREAERVLMMQFVGDAREGRDERRRRFQLEVAAAG